MNLPIAQFDREPVVAGWCLRCLPERGEQHGVARQDIRSIGPEAEQFQIGRNGLGQYEVVDADLIDAEGASRVGHFQRPGNGLCRTQRSDQRVRRGHMHDAGDQAGLLIEDVADPHGHRKVAGNHAEGQDEVQG